MIIEVVYYQDIVMVRAYCSTCKAAAFIIDGHYTCCGKKAPAIKDITGVLYSREAGDIKRIKCPKKIQNEILMEQNNKCKWCGYEFGEIISNKKNKEIKHLNKVHFDHKIPFIYIGNPVSNWVAACDICNSIKSAHYFKTYEDAYQWIGNRRLEYGWPPGKHYQND